MNKSEKRAQTFLYMGVLLTLIAADWHWYLGEFPEESFVAGLPVMQVVYVLWIAAIVICLSALKPLPKMVIIRVPSARPPMAIFLFFLM